MVSRISIQFGAERAIQLACRVLPDDERVRWVEEWTAELPAILNDPDRHFRSVRALTFAIGQLRSVRELMHRTEQNIAALADFSPIREKMIQTLKAVTDAAERGAIDDAATALLNTRAKTTIIAIRIQDCALVGRGGSVVKIPLEREDIEWFDRNIKEQNYPELLFVGATLDDDWSVRKSHRMAAKLGSSRVDIEFGVNRPQYIAAVCVRKSPWRPVAMLRHMRSRVSIALERDDAELP